MDSTKNSTNQDRDTGGKHDDETGPAAEPEPNLYDLLEDLDNRIRWARATVGLIASDEQTEAAIGNAADAADSHLAEARELVDQLQKWRLQNKPTKPRDLSDGYQREEEKRELVRRLIPLSHDDFNEVMMCGMFISTAADRNEALHLLDKYPLSYVHHFLSVQKDQAKASEAAAGEGGAA
jgi:hypothetical protein